MLIVTKQVVYIHVVYYIIDKDMFQDFTWENSEGHKSIVPRFWSVFFLEDATISPRDFSSVQGLLVNVA